jgi:hypothetical protein
MRIAKGFLRSDVDQFLSELTTEQFEEWVAFESIEPSGAIRDDLRAAKIICAIINTCFGRTKDSPLAQPGDVFDTLAPDPLAPQSPEQMRTTLGGGRRGTRSK